MLSLQIQDFRYLFLCMAVRDRRFEPHPDSLPYRYHSVRQGFEAPTSVFGSCDSPGTAGDFSAALPGKHSHCRWQSFGCSAACQGGSGRINAFIDCREMVSKIKKTCCSRRCRAPQSAFLQAGRPAAGEGVNGDTDEVFGFVRDGTALSYTTSSPSKVCDVVVFAWTGGSHCVVYFPPPAVFAKLPKWLPACLL